jgi:hypothetical protein
MSTHNDDKPLMHKAIQDYDIQPSPEGGPGYEFSDANTGNVLVFMACMLVFLAVFFVVCFGMGKLINHELVVHDGPPNVWTQMAYGPQSSKKREDMVNSPTLMQQQLKLMSTNFPTPRLETDDGNQDLTDLHNREDLLLEHYSYIDQGAGTVRIPIERAMMLVVQRGLAPVGGVSLEAGAGAGAGVKAGATGAAANAKSASAGGPVEPMGEMGGQTQNVTAGNPALAGVEPVRVTRPLTDGFARTAYEQEQEEIRQQRLESRDNEQQNDKQNGTPAMSPAK